jgi:hypothetical protein
MNSHLAGQPHVVPVAVKRDTSPWLLSVEAGNSACQWDSFHDFRSRWTQMVREIRDTMTIVKQHQGFPSTFVIHTGN